MTLHEAIEKLLREAQCAMTTEEIAEKLNKLKWYQKKDGSPLTAYQIHGRTQNYHDIFDRDGSLVSLKGRSKERRIEISTVEKLPPKLSEIKGDNKLLSKVLMNAKNFKSAGEIDNWVPDVSGLYCVRIKDVNVLDVFFSKVLVKRGHNILYIGIASQSLKKRFLNQELRANGHGTFFRSLGAMLGYQPEKGSLKGKLNKRNYKFSKQTESEIIQWINKHLIVNWIELNEGFDDLETDLIKEHLPLMNLAKNPQPSMLLSELRAECVRIANE